MHWTYFALPDMGMDAAGDFGARRGHDFATEIKPILLLVRCPTFLKSVCLLPGSDTETNPEVLTMQQKMAFVLANDEIETYIRREERKTAPDRLI